MDQLSLGIGVRKLPTTKAVSDLFKPMEGGSATKPTLSARILSSTSFHLKGRLHGNGITYVAASPGAAENR